MKETQFKQLGFFNNQPNPTCSESQFEVFNVQYFFILLAVTLLGLKEPAEIDTNIKTMLKNGEDPKEMVIQYCEPSCTFWKEKLGRCEAVLKSMKNADPEMSCMYPLRDWVTCVEACVLNHKWLYEWEEESDEGKQVQPKIQGHLVGNH